MSRGVEGPPDLVLASASPRRLDLLQTIGIRPIVAPADVDEAPFAGEKPSELVERLAAAKARSAWLTRSAQSALKHDGSGRAPAPRAAPLVVAADTVIDRDGEIFGKPVDDADAIRMLQALSGRSHDVLTGMAVIGFGVGVGADDGEPLTVSTVGRTEVWIRALEPSDIEWYLGSGEYRGKAGAYAIQGLGSLLVERIEGSYQNVVGLSLPGLDGLTRRFGWALRDLATG